MAAGGGGTSAGFLNVGGGGISTGFLNVGGGDISAGFLNVGGGGTSAGFLNVGGGGISAGLLGRILVAFAEGVWAFCVGASSETSKDNAWIGVDPEMLAAVCCFCPTGSVAFCGEDSAGKE